MKTRKSKYYIGLIKKNHDTVAVQMSTVKDCLSCELWQYQGEYMTTKAHVRLNKADLLVAINGEYHTNFHNIVVL